MEGDYNYLTPFVVDLDYEDDTTAFSVPISHSETKQEQFEPKFARHNNVSPTPEYLSKALLIDHLFDGIFHVFNIVQINSIIVCKHRTPKNHEIMNKKFLQDAIQWLLNRTNIELYGRNTKLFATKWQVAKQHTI